MARLPQIDMVHQRRCPWRLRNSQPQSDSGQRPTCGRSGSHRNSADPGGPALLYFTGTGHTLVQAADGSRTVIYGHGPVENVCKTLAG